MKLFKSTLVALLSCLAISAFFASIGEAQDFRFVPRNEEPPLPPLPPPPPSHNEGLLNSEEVHFGLISIEEVTHRSKDGALKPIGGKTAPHSPEDTICFAESENYVCTSAELQPSDRIIRSYCDSWSGALVTHELSDPRATGCYASYFVSKINCDTYCWSKYGSTGSCKVQEKPCAEEVSSFGNARGIYAAACSCDEGSAFISEENTNNLESAKGSLASDLSSAKFIPSRAP